MEPAIIIPILVLLLLGLSVYAEDQQEDDIGFCRGLTEYDTQGEWL